MTTEIKEAIRSHLRANDAIQETIEWDHIVARLDRDQSTHTSSRLVDRRGVLVAMAVAIATLVLVGIVALLAGDATQTADTNTPSTVPESVTPTTVPATVTPPDIEGANLSQLLNLESFLLPMVNYGGCSGPMGGPYVCTASVGPPYVDEGVGIEVTVGPDDDEGHPDELERMALLGAQLEAMMRGRLAELYESALIEQPDATREKCGEGFTGTNQVLALSPGFAAVEDCGVHLATVTYGLVDAEFLQPSDQFSTETSFGTLNWTMYRTPHVDTPFWVQLDPFEGYLAGDWNGEVWHSTDGHLWKIVNRAFDMDRRDGGFEELDPNETESPSTEDRQWTSQSNWGTVVWGSSAESYAVRIWIGNSMGWEEVPAPAPPEPTVIGPAAFGSPGWLLFVAYSGNDGDILWIGRFTDRELYRP